MSPVGWDGMGWQRTRLDDAQREREKMSRNRLNLVMGPLSVSHRTTWPEWIALLLSANGLVSWPPQMKMSLFSFPH